ncbi:MAG: tRNA pseudouridine(38-40) synthase TruA [bacterium]|nr:tRNA pseudouridine(38-40) synthase TruA [bacterium]
MTDAQTRRLVLWIEYDGTDFNGWQVQPGQRTVQSEIEAALSKMCNEPVRIVGSGRTDSGVHALGQVAHFNARSAIPPFKFALGLNTLLARDISITDCREVYTPFHAQHDALRKTYRYRILFRRRPSALRRHCTWHVKSPLDIAAMQKAAEILQGERDFESFRAEGTPVESTVRNLERLEVRPVEDELHIEATANGFLRHMVRNIVGTLVEVGRGDRTPGSMADLLGARDRKQAAPTCPPQGLTLVCVDYGEKMPPEAPPDPSEKKG